MATKTIKIHPLRIATFPEQNYFDFVMYVDGVKHDISKLAGVEQACSTPDGIDDNVQAKALVVETLTELLASLNIEHCHTTMTKQTTAAYLASFQDVVIPMAHRAVTYGRASLRPASMF